MACRWGSHPELVPLALSSSLTNLVGKEAGASEPFARNRARPKPTGG